METSHFSSNSTVGHSEGGFPSIHHFVANFGYAYINPGYIDIVFSQETTFIEQLVEDESQMEGTPAGCSRIMNWHLHLEARNLVYPRGWLLQKNLDVVLPIK